MSANCIINSKGKNRDRPFLIGISGGSGGGKTSVAGVIHRCLGKDNCLLFSMDTYYKDLTPEQEKDLNNYNFDTPDALDLDLIYEHLHSLMNWQSIEMPTYDFATNKRQKETKHLRPHNFIIFEGILAFYDKRIRDLMDLKLFIDLDDDMRLSRRIYRDIISRGRKMQDVIDRYHKFVKPAYNSFIKPTKEYADLVIPRGGSNTIAINLINYYLKYKSVTLFPENIKNLLKENNTNDNKEKANDNDINDNEKNNDINNFISQKLSKKENIVSIKEEDIFDKNICLLEENEKQLFFKIFKNILSSEKYHYFDLYSDILTKKINSFVKNKIIIIKKDEINDIEATIRKNRKKIKNGTPLTIYIYMSMLFEDEKLKFCLDYLKNQKEVGIINVICIFLKTEIFEKYTEENKVQFKAIYCGKAVDMNKNKILKSNQKQGEYSNNTITFSESKFDGKLAELMELNKKI